MCEHREARAKLVCVHLEEVHYNAENLQCCITNVFPCSLIDKKYKQMWIVCFYSDRGSASRKRKTH